MRHTDRCTSIQFESRWIPLPHQLLASKLLDPLLALPCTKCIASHFNLQKETSSSLQLIWAPIKQIFMPMKVSWVGGEMLLNRVHLMQPSNQRKLKFSIQGHQKKELMVWGGGIPFFKIKRSQQYFEFKFLWHLQTAVGIKKPLFLNHQTPEQVTRSLTQAWVRRA